MHQNAELIRKFYTSFGHRDHRGMAACYHPAIEFSDEVFTDLKGARAAGMWQMLCERGKDLKIEFSDVEADDSTGRAHWEAWYTFSTTGRRVHNKIDASFEFRDGKIIRHRDRFDFWAWASQALGPTGRLLGWSGFVKKRVRSQAAKNLAAFLHGSETQDHRRVPRSNREPVFVKRYLAPSDFTAAETWRLVDWCNNLGANEFTIDSIGTDGVLAKKLWHQFEKVVTPFSRGEKTRERMSGRTADDLTRSTQLWELNQLTIEALKQALPGGLLQYEPWEGGWFEDPVIYREGRLMLGTLSHEAFAVLCITDLESAQLAAVGFPSHDSLPRIG